MYLKVQKDDVISIYIASKFNNLIELLDALYNREYKRVLYNREIRKLKMLELNRFNKIINVK